MRGKRVCCRMEWLNFVVFTEMNSIDGLQLAMEPVNFNKARYALISKYGADPKVEGQRTQSESLSQVKRLPISLS